MTLNEQLAAIEAELIRQTGCRTEEIAGVYQTPISKPVVNARMGEALRARFAAEDERDALRAQNAAFLATQKSFTASLAERIAELEAQRDKAPVTLRLEINGQIGLIQAIAHDYNVVIKESESHVGE